MGTVLPESPLAPGLYLVATPIGNLGDITIRALDVLRRVDRIACEDTRQTQKLLNHFEITTPTVSCHQHNEHARATELIQNIKAGKAIAVVSVPKVAPDDSAGVDDAIGSLDESSGKGEVLGRRQSPQQSCGCLDRRKGWPQAVAQR